MSLFFIKHTHGIHEVTDVKKHKTNIELRTATGEILHLIVITDESYTVYDDRFAGAAKQLNSIEVYDIDGSFRNIDFDTMRQMFSNAFTELLETLSQFVGSNQLVNLDEIRHEVSDHNKGLHFKIITDTKMYEYNI
ncbi:hypothetical protein [Lysinibacillus sp. LZ02]|uniref:hypothetical protein n=1 Tax=Lysinibacillus sp. LZ02 TaxID=3420668 RepID=UPI003D3657B3